MRPLLFLAALLLPSLSFADSMPSDAVVQQKMSDMHQSWNTTMQQTQNLPVKPLVIPGSRLDVPSFMQQGFSSIARDAQIAASQITSPTHNRRALMLAVSLSMPESVLQEYAQQAEEAHARILLRGVPPGQTIPQIAILIKRINQNHHAEWSIDPPLFRRFKLVKVPALLFVDEESAQKLENQCAPTLSFLEVDGEVSIRQGLSIMALDHSHLGELAARKLDDIEHGRNQE